MIIIIHKVTSMRPQSSQVKHSGPLKSQHNSRPNLHKIKRMRAVPTNTLSPLQFIAKSFNTISISPYPWSWLSIKYNHNNQWI